MESSNASNKYGNRYNGHKGVPERTVKSMRTPFSKVFGLEAVPENRWNNEAKLERVSKRKTAEAVFFGGWIKF